MNIPTTNLSVVIPAFNAAGWITRCLEHLAIAFENAGIRNPDVIVVDDGSTDGTGDEARSFTGFPIRVIRQENLGRFKARENGLESCRGSHVLFIDSRVFMGPDSLTFVLPYLNDLATSVWTADVQAATTGNQIARFWRAIETVFWRRYMKNPRTTSFGLEDFDYYPKGTTALIVPRPLIREAIDEFSPSVSDWRKVNDDTALLRYAAARTRINISPHYTCAYNARTNLRAFVKHANHRGSVLIDGYLRRGTRLNAPIWIVLLLAPVGVVLAGLRPDLALLALIATPCAISGLAKLFGARLADVAVLAILFWPFALSYLAGMYWGLWLKFRGASTQV